MIKTIRIYLLAWKYFMEQGFTDWERALQDARILLDLGWRRI